VPTQTLLLRRLVSRSSLLLAVMAAAMISSLLFRAPLTHADKPFVESATSTQKDSGQAKLAEGEYVIYEQSNDGAVGPFPEQIYNFNETWTLSRNGNGGYKVEGVRKFESPRNESNSDRFIVTLSRGFTITRAQEFTKLKWVQDSGPLTCDFFALELSCSSGGSNSEHLISLRIPMKHPYGLLWPISPFSLSGITRQVEHSLTRPTEVDMVSIVQPSRTNPVAPTVLEGPIQYMGEDNIRAAGRNWRAFKFSLKVPMHPRYVIWTSQNGLLLGVAMEHPHKDWQDEGLRLARFQGSDKF